MGSSVILTGGWDNTPPTTLTTVSEYIQAGWVRDLPDLLQGRLQHGCSYYDNNEGSQVRY